MKIAVIGAGAVGKFITGRLTQNKIDVTLIARKAQVQKIQSHGIILSTKKNQENISVNVLSKIESEYDLVIFAVQTQDLERAFLEHADYLEKAYVLTVQGTVQAENILSAHFEKEKIFSSTLTSYFTNVNETHVHCHHEGQWIIGKPFAPIDAMLHVMLDFFSESFSMFLSHDINAMKWNNLFRRLPEISAAVMNIPILTIFENEQLSTVQLNIFDEALLVLKRAEIPVMSLPDFSKDLFSTVDKDPHTCATDLNNAYGQCMDKEFRGSFSDLLQNQKQTEIDFLNGEFMHLAYQMRLETPLNKGVVDMVNEVWQSGQFLTVDKFQARMAGLTCG